MGQHIITVVDKWVPDEDDLAILEAFKENMARDDAKRAELSIPKAKYDGKSKQVYFEYIDKEEISSND